MVDDIDKNKEVDKGMETLKKQGRVSASEAQPEDLEVSIVHQNGCCKVEPAVLHARPGDTISWKFEGTSTGGRLFFPHEGFSDKVVYNILPDEPLKLPMQGVVKGRYPYAVYCKAHNCFAVGNSDPRVDYP